MIDLPLYNHDGSKVGAVAFDESVFGAFVNRPLLHAAIVMFEANQRQGTVKTKNVREVVGISAKPFKQKGTGRARMGKKRRFGSRGGATCFGPRPRDYSLAMPKSQRRAALRSALLGRFKADDVVVLKDWVFDAPKTAKVAKFLSAIQADRGALIITADHDEMFWLSARNLPKTDMQSVREMSAYSVLRRPRVIFTESALQALPEQVAKKKATKAERAEKKVAELALAEA